MFRLFIRIIFLCVALTGASLYANPSDKMVHWWYGKENAEHSWFKRSITIESQALSLLTTAEWFVQQLGQDDLFTSVAPLSRYQVNYQPILVDYQLDPAQLKKLKDTFAAYMVRFFPDAETPVELPNLIEALRILRADGDLLKVFLRLSPLLYGTNLQQDKITFLNLQQKTLDTTTVVEDSTIDSFLNHIYPLVKKWATLEQDTFLLNTLESVKNQFFERVVRSHLQLKQVLIPHGNALSEMYLEEAHPLVAVFRAEWTGDCSRNSVPMHVLSPDVKAFYIRKIDDFEVKPSGYALVLNTVLNGQSIPYILTINGDLSSAEVRGLSISLAKMYNADQFIVPDFKKNYWLANTDSMRFGMNSFRSTKVKVEIPESFKNISDLRKRMPKNIPNPFLHQDYYSAENISDAKLVIIREQENPNATVTKLKSAVRYEPSELPPRTRTKESVTASPQIIFMDASQSMSEYDRNFLHGSMARGAATSFSTGRYADTLNELYNQRRGESPLNRNTIIITDGPDNFDPTPQLTPQQLLKKPITLQQLLEQKKLRKCARFLEPL